MLTAPDQQNRPLFSAKDIIPFYNKHGAKIFPTSNGILKPMVKMMGILKGPMYNGKYLRKLLRNILGDRKLHEALTRIIIPTFDINLLQPTIFSSYEAETDASKDALMSDVCIGTSAAPVYFPPYYFKTEDSEGNTREFHLVDGGVAANNPALLAIKPTGSAFTDMPSQALNYGKYLVISLGTGTSKTEKKYNAKMAGKWGVMDWLYMDGNSPLVDAFTYASSDMVDLHMSLMFRSVRCEDNYLRIQDDTLCGEESNMDKATQQNMQNLVKIGQRLLQKPVSRLNIDTGLFEPVVDGGTNEQALTRFARILSEERRLRSNRSQHA